MKNNLNINKIKFVVISNILFGSTFIFADQVSTKVGNLVNYVTSIGLVCCVGFFAFEILSGMATGMGLQRAKWCAFSAVLMAIAKYLLPALIQTVS